MKMIQEKTEQQFLDLSTPAGKKRVRKRKNSFKNERHLLIRRITEIINGQRATLKVYSKSLQRHLYIVNEGLVDIKENNFDEEVMTMKKLAELCYTKAQSDKSKK